MKYEFIVTRLEDGIRRSVWCWRGRDDGWITDDLRHVVDEMLDTSADWRRATLTIHASGRVLASKGES